jgi:hypothetical protein
MMTQKDNTEGSTAIGQMLSKQVAGIKKLGLGILLTKTKGYRLLKKKVRAL